MIGEFTYFVNLCVCDIGRVLRVAMVVLGGGIVISDTSLVVVDDRVGAKFAC